MSDIRVRNTLNYIPKKVLNAYFASKTEETVSETVKGTATKYNAVSGDSLSKIASKHGITVAKLKADNNLTSTAVKVEQVFIIKKEDSKKEKGKKITFTKLKKASLGQEVYIIVETENLEAIDVEINVMQGKEKVLEEKDVAIYLLKDNKRKIKTIVGEFSKNDKITNKDDFKNWAIAKVNLAPKENDKLKEYNDALKKATDKKTFLYLAVNACTNSEDDVNYYNGNGELDETDTSNYYLNEEGKWLEFKKKSPVIVLDPGHGVHGGNVGAQARRYKYKLKGSDGKVKLDKDKKEITDLKDIMSLPQYVIDNPSKWIVGDNESSNHKYDNDRTEYGLTYDVASKMQSILKAKGYDNIILTRTSKDITKVTGHKLAYRIDIANNNKADYFISIHADGSKNFTSGAHAIYSNTDSIDESKKISNDIMKYYKVVEVESDSPKKDVRGLRVLRTTNKTKRKTLVELGFLTSPSDAKKMFSNINLMAEQLTKGLIENIEANF